MMKSLLRALALVLGVTPLLAQATLVNITVTGTIDDSYDETGTLFGQGSGYDIVNGQTIVLKFTYDTNTAPGDYYGGTDPEYAFYDGGNSNWIESSATINGNAVSNFYSGNSYSGTYVNNYIEMSDYIPNSSTPIYDEVGVYDYSYGYNDGNTANGNYFFNESLDESLFYFYSYVENLLNGVALNQSFSLVADGNNSYGTGWISRYRDDRECSDASCTTTYKEDYQYAYASFEINAISATVPEPGSLALLGLGMSGLAFVRRRKAVN